MKSNNYRADARVPWRLILSVFFSLSFLSFAKNACCQQDLVQNSYTANATIPNYLRLNEVNRHASRHFMDHFLDDGTEKWLREKDTYVANFTADQIRNRAYYKSNGDFEFIVKTYGEETLGREMKNAIWQQFPGYHILVVLEITDLEKSVYTIKIANRENIKTITSLDGRLEVTESILNGGF